MESGRNNPLAYKKDRMPTEGYCNALKIATVVWRACQDHTIVSGDWLRPFSC